MSIVFVNDWNGYGGGIFDTFENALEDMAILAVAGGIEAHEERIESIEYLAKPLTEIGFGGTRQDRNLYAIVSADLNTEMFSIRTHDTKTRPGHSSRTKVMINDDMKDPVWAVQKALFDFSSEDYTDGSGLRDELVASVEELVWTVRMEAKSPEDAIANLRGTGVPNLASAVHARLFEADISDATEFLDSLPERAGDLFAEIVVKAFPGTVFGYESAEPAR